MVDLIAEKTESLCGFRPAPEDVEEFLDSLTIKSSKSDTSPSPNLALQKAAGKHVVSDNPISESGVEYKVFGTSRHASNATEALLDILRTLAQRDLRFVETLAPLVPGRSRNHISRSRDQVYPMKPELIEYTVELVPGWWLGTNIANREKMRILKIACEVAGLSLGKDVIITLPNAT